MLQNSLRYLKGVGPKKEAIFNGLGVYTIKDLLYYFPFRYEDRRNFKKIKELKENELALVKGKVLAKHLKRMPYYFKSKRVRDIFEIALSDETAVADCIWFNQGFLDDSLNVGDEIIVYGKVSFEGGRFKFSSPQYELFSKDNKSDGETNSLNFGRIVGIYRLSSIFTQKFMRKTIFSTLNKFRNDVPESLPFYIRQEKKLPNIVRSLEEIHFPICFEEVKVARERFIFEELFFSQILVYLRKAKHRLQEATPFNVKEELLASIKKNLKFSLTASQQEALSQIISDIKKPCPMHRLLQGDVGCGKTVVASFAIGACVDCGFQAALMVPTEVLAYQHKETLDKIFKGLSFKTEVLTSSLSKKEIERVHRDLKEGKVDIIVGTHALIQENVEFNKLALVIIDEQHKFGVAQRALLPKKGKNPHCLVMSATPIPRSLALSLYGDLDLSVIKEFPQGRVLAKTKWVREDQREWVYNFLKEKLAQKRQVYIIYPVIEESEDEDLRSLEEMYGRIKKVFSSFNTGIFHGRLSAKEKLAAIKKFKQKEIDILVSTTVVEVGVNIENATAMIIENPERFGLAQLHQLRGRIQRSSYESNFILLGKSELSELAFKRLEVITSVNDGFVIAEEDLKLRGPGDFFGEVQHGLPNLKIANPLKDLEILTLARHFAYQVIKSDPNLESTQHKCVREHLDYWFKK
ncbi:MAG: ATP-dependent DNA helicase RecG [Candidatus Omnitrophota bacterium]|nr:ATP-dependent DNA helicase RecG [Candidatus Omnitrophota bacterium]